VTSDEAFSRVVRGHPWIIGICLVLPLLVVGLTQLGRGATYASVSRVQVAATLPGSTTEADAASSRATAVVTSPSVVARALAEAGLSGDPTKFATEHVAVTRIGVSPVVAVSVTTASPATAQQVASSLSSQLVAGLNSDAQTNARHALALVNGQIAKAQAARNRVAQHLLVSPTGPQAASNQSQLPGLNDELNALRTERAQLAVAAEQPPVAKLVDPATRPDTTVPSVLLQRLGLALIFGLLLGLGIAALVESLRPRVPSPGDAARRLGVPHVGDLGSAASSALVAPARRLAELARESGVTSVALVPVPPLSRTKAVGAAAQLAADPLGVLNQAGRVAPGHRVLVVPLADSHQGSEQTGRDDEPVRWRPRDADDLDAANDPLAGLVVLVGTRTRASDLRRVEDEVRATGRPLLAVLGIRGRLEAAAAAPETPSDPAAADRAPEVGPASVTSEPEDRKGAEKPDRHEAPRASRDFQPSTPAAGAQRESGRG
jgi:capsular polysaccharide biosynthesis protein